MEKTPALTEHRIDQEEESTRTRLIEECARNIVQHKELTEKIIAVNQCAIDRNKESYPYNFGTFVSPDGQVLDVSNDGENRNSPTGWTVALCSRTNTAEEGFPFPIVEKLDVFDISESQYDNKGKRADASGRTKPLLVAINTIHCVNGVSFNLFVTRDTQEGPDSYTISDHEGRPFLPLSEIATVITSEYRSTDDINREFQEIIRQSYENEVEHQRAVA